MSGSTLACPVCNTDLQCPDALAPDAEAHVSCGLCATEAVIMPGGTVMTEVEWQRRPKSEAGGAEQPAVTSQAAPPPHAVPASQAAPMPDADRAAHTEDVLTKTTEPAPSPLDARAFEGSLKNLSVFDVLQLLCSSRKTGVLKVTHGEAVASITLDQGHIIGCEHPTRGTQIGRLLVQAGAVTEVDLQAALEQQDEAGPNRQRLVATLVAMGKVDKQVGWKVLEQLVEDTVLTTLGWLEGTFVFEVGGVDSSDDFQHLITGVADPPGVDVQATLLEALRVLDEGRREPAEEETTLEGFDDAFNVDNGPSAAVASTPDVQVEPLEPPPAPMEPTDAGSKLSTQLAALQAMLEQPFGRRIGIAAAAVVVLLVALSVWLASGPSDEATAVNADPGGVAADAQTPTPEPLVGDEPETPPPEPMPLPTPEPAVTSTTEEPPAPVMQTKRRRKGRKRKVKAKSARSLFDAALE
ncbi:MAG: DUF4388 domain-containing protein [Myxococcota bacterium]